MFIPKLDCTTAGLLWFYQCSCGWFDVCSTLEAGRGGQKIEIVLLDFLQDEDLEAKAWKCCLGQMCLIISMCFHTGFVVCTSFVVPTLHVPG